MLKTILTLMLSIVQNYTMKLFCLLAIVVPYAAYVFGLNDLVKHGFLAMLYLAIVWAITPFFMSASTIERLHEQE